MSVALKLLSQVAAETPDKIAIGDGDGQWTYGQLAGRVATLAAACRNELGLARGDRCAVLLHNRAAAVELQLAAGLAGFIAIPVNYRSTADELAYILADSGSKALFYEGALNTVVSRAAKPSGLKTIGLAGAASDIDYESLTSGAHGPVPERSLEAVTSLRYTSGTTGRPKAARRDVAPAVSLQVMQNFVDEFGYQNDEVHLAACPLYHSAPPVFANLALQVGGQLLIQNKFGVETWLAAVAERRVTSAFIVPTILQRLCDAPAELRQRYDTSSLRSVIVAAAKCPAQLKLAAVAAFGEIFYEFYGSTEGSVNTIVKPSQFARKPESCGRAFPGNQIKIIAPDGRACGDYEAGEICIKNAFMIRSYENAADKTQEAFSDDGFYKSGDIGYRDSDGDYFIVDRIKDMIISGGVNIYPAEIESEFRKHPAVADVAAVGVPDAQWGESVKAVFVLKPDANVGEGELRRFADERLADYKRPRLYEFRAEMPYTPEGKLRKRDLR